MSLPSPIQSYLEDQHELQQELNKTNIGELMAAKKIIDSKANHKCLADLVLEAISEQELINDKKSLVAEEV